MIQEFNYKGQWFLPENPENKVSGILTFDAKSDPKLELYGTFSSRKEFLRETDLILGITVAGEYITLYNSVEVERHNTNGNEASIYSTFYVLKGCHYHTMESLVVNRISGRFKNLDKWVNEYGYKINHDSLNADSFSVNYKKPDDLTISLNDNLKATLRFFYDHPFTETINTIKLNQFIYYELEYQTPVKFMEALDNLCLFQNFITLSCYEPAYPLAISVITIPQPDNECWSALFYKPGFNYIATETSYRKFLFRYTDIKDNFESIIKKWYSVSKELEPVSDLMFSNFYLREKSPVNNFLNVMQALETYHRLFKDSKPFNKEEYDQWASNLVSMVSNEQYREMLEQKLKYANEQSLPKRIKDLVTNLPIDSFKDIIGKEKSLIYKASNNRNYYTHYGAELKKEALTGIELSKLTQRLHVLLICTILLELNFTTDQIDKILKGGGNLHFHHLTKKI